MSADLEKQVAVHSQQIKSLEKRVLKCENKDEVLNKLVVSVETMAVVQKEMLEDIKAERERRDKNEERIHKLEMKPAEEHEFTKKELIKVVVGVVVGGLLGALIGLIVK